MEVIIMSKKSIVVKLDADSLQELKQSGYSLCFAKKVNDDYDVVWQSSTKYLSKNTFSWEPEYAVFGTNTYETSIKVEADTDVVSAELGQQCTLDANGIMKSAITGTNPLGVTVENQYGPIHFGMSQVCIIDGKEQITPIYVSKESRTTGEIVLTPKEKVMVWFEANVETSTIFEDAKTNAIEIDLTNKQEQTISYDYEAGTWKVLETK